MADWQWTEEEMATEVAAALRTGARARGPRAVNARCSEGRLVVDLASGATLMVPVALLEGLAGAAAEDLAAVAVSPGGQGLRWERLDVDLGVAGLLAGSFGSRRWMRRLAHRAA